MDPAITVLLAMMTTMLGVGTPLIVREFKDLRSRSDKNSERQIVVETKLDMLLDHSGFDMRKVNRAIKDNLDEIKQNDKPSVGCIHIAELYKNQGGKT